MGIMRECIHFSRCHQSRRSYERRKRGEISERKANQERSREEDYRVEEEEARCRQEQGQEESDCRKKRKTETREEKESHSESVRSFVRVNEEIGSEEKERQCAQSEETGRKEVWFGTVGGTKTQKEETSLVENTIETTRRKGRGGYNAITNIVTEFTLVAFIWWWQKSRRQVREW